MSLSDEQLTQADKAWGELERVFSNFKGMRLRLTTFLNGLPEGVRPKRLQILRNKGSATSFQKITEDLSKDQMSYLSILARINLDRSVSGLRLMLIANVTIPVGGLIFLSQFAPEFLDSLLDLVGIPVNVLIGALVGATIYLWLTVWYGYAGTTQARDLVHLFDMRLAREERTSGDMPSSDDGLSDIGDIEGLS